MVANRKKLVEDIRSLLKDMREREAAATRELKAHREQETMQRKEMLRLRAEIDALRAQVTRANLLAPDANDLQVELASVRASIYDAKSKNDALLAENQKLSDENVNLHAHIQYLQKQQSDQHAQKYNEQIQQLQQHRQQQLLQHQQQKQFQQQILQFQKNQHYSRSPTKNPPQQLPFDATQLSIDLENAENRVRALEHALQSGEISKNRTALKAELKALYT